MSCRPAWLAACARVGLAGRSPRPPAATRPSGLGRHPAALGGSTRQAPRPLPAGPGHPDRPWDLLWVDGSWPCSCHEHQLLQAAWLEELLDAVEVASLIHCGFRGRQDPPALARSAGDRTHQRPAHPWAAGVQPPAGGAAIAGKAVDPASGQRVGAARLAGLLHRVRDVFRAFKAVVRLRRWFHRVST